MLRKLIQAGAVLALLTGAAYAQMPMPGISLSKPERPLTPEEKARQKQIEDAYKAANSKIPDQQNSDPWADVRSAPPNSKKKQQ